MTKPIKPKPPKPVPITTPGIQTKWQPVVKPEGWLVPHPIMYKERLQA